MIRIADGSNYDEKLLTSLWNNTDWDKFENILFGMQRDIALAAKNNDYVGILTYQKKLTQSLYAKLLAVRQVVENGSTPGIDKVQWNTPSEYMKAALSLNDDGYRALPMKLTIIYSKFSKKERRLKIPTYYDRAMQTLHSYALGPVGETIGDRRSFAFRKNRSTQDVHAYIMSALKKNGYYIVKADVKSCYESINHDWLLSNIPMDTVILREFLKAGHVSAGKFFQAEDNGISLGVSISPILGNMALDGMQQAIFENLHGLRYNEDYSDGYLIRFADDIFVTANSIERAKKIISIIDGFLKQRGMCLSQEKTSIINVHQGFDFLSRYYIRNGKIIVSCPSDTAIMKMEQNLHKTILSFRGSQKTLIDKLNKKLYGWASYHKITDARNAFRHIDILVKTLLLQLCEQLHPGWTRQKVIDRYFFRDHSGEYVYALPNKKDVRVIRLSDIALMEHIPSKNTNIYLLPLDDKNFEELRNVHNVIGKYKTVWNRQNGICYYCGEQILADQKKSIIHVRKLGTTNNLNFVEDFSSDTKKRPIRTEVVEKTDICMVKPQQKKLQYTKNLAYIHEKCNQHEVEFICTEEPIENHNDISHVIKELHDKPKKRKTYRKFEMLTEYFQQRTEQSITLTFKDLTNILEISLCKTAFTNKGYWRQKSPGSISNAWLSNGYKIKRINLLDQKIVFVRAENGLPVKIPAVFLSGRVPKNVKAELETFLDYLTKKYGL